MFQAVFQLYFAQKWKKLNLDWIIPSFSCFYLSDPKCGQKVHETRPWSDFNLFTRIVGGNQVKQGSHPWQVCRSKCGFIFGTKPFFLCFYRNEKRRKPLYFVILCTYFHLECITELCSVFQWSRQRGYRSVMIYDKPLLIIYYLIISSEKSVFRLGCVKRHEWNWSEIKEHLSTPTIV